MSWSSTKKKILSLICRGTGLNTFNTTHRVVLSVRQDISSGRYGYMNETGFVVQIGTNSSINVPLGVLKVCHSALHTANGYDGDFFRKHFPLQASDHPCHVHVVGQILVVAGLAKRKGNGYH